MVLEEILSILPSKVHYDKSSDSKVLTPLKVAHEMIDALPDEVWTRDIKIIDICCKSGVFLYEAYLKLMESKELISEFPDRRERHFHIINNQLYGLCPDEQCQFISMRTVYGQLRANSNIIYIKDYSSIINNVDKSFLYETLKKEFGTMQFDIVITNPPYNRGMDLDFVDLAYKLSSQYTVAITPAKWQTAAPDQRIASKISYGEFRAKYVPHMSQVVFYPDSKDVFDIEQCDGITWSVLDKNTHEKCKVINKCRYVSHFNSVDIRNIRERESLHNVGAEIVHRLGVYETFKFKPSLPKRYQVYVNSQTTLGKTKRSMLVSSDNDMLVVGANEIIDNTYGIGPMSGTCTLAFTSDSREECENFVSWLNTKFTRFFVAINISKLTGIINNDSFRFVPAPPLNPDTNTYDWSHPYTDEFLYDYYKVSPEHQSIINSIIRERK